MNKIKSAVIAACSLAAMFVTGSLYADGPSAGSAEVVALVNFRGNSGSAVEGWSDLDCTKDGGSDGTNKGSVTFGDVTVKVDGISGGNNFAQDSVGGDYAAGTYTDIFGNSFGTIAEEVASSLNLGSIQFNADIYKTGFHNGQGGQNCWLTISGLDSSAQYVAYLGFGLNGHTSGLNLAANDCESVGSISYVTTVNGVNTSTATQYTEVSEPLGKDFKPGNNGLLIVRINELEPKSDGTVKIHLINSGGCNFLAISSVGAEPVQTLEAMISADTSWDDITWEPDEYPTLDTKTELTIEGAVTLTMDQNTQFKSLKLLGDGDLTIVGLDPALLASVKVDGFEGTVTYELDVTGGFEADATLLGRIKNAVSKEKFVFNGDGEYGATLNFGTSVKTLHTHIVFNGGKHSMTWQGNGLFAADATNDNPTLLVEGETTFDFNAKDISGYSGGVDVSGVIRVKDGGTLNFLQIDANTIFYRQRLCIDPGALVTFTCDKAGNGESRFRWQGGAVQGKEQIYVPASDEDATDKPAIIRQLGDGGFLLASDNTRGCAMFVGKNSKLIFDCSVTELSSNNAVLAKFGEGEFEMAAERESEEGFAADFSAQEGIVSLVNEPVFRNFTASDQVTYRFPEGTEREEAVGLCTGTLVSPGRVMDKTVYVGDQLEEGVSLVYDAEGKSVAYADAIGEIELYDNTISVSDINTAFEEQGLTGEQPVKLSLRAEGAIELVLDATLREEITDLYVAQDYDGSILLTPVEGVDYFEVLFPFDLSAVKGHLKYGWLKHAGAKVIAVNFNRKGFDANDANGNEDSIIGDNEDSEALDCNIPGKGFLQVDTRSSDWTGDAFAFDTATDEKIASGELQVKWSSNNNYRWSSDSVAKFLRGYLDDGGSHAQFYAKGIPFEYYDVIVYFATDQASRSFSPVTVNGKSYCWDSQAEATVIGDTTWGSCHNFSPAYGVNALCIEKCWGELTVVGGANANQARGGIAAIVIVENKDVKKQEIPTGSVAYANENRDPTADLVVIRPTDGALVVDATPAIDYIVSGTGALKLQDSPDHQLTAEDLAKLQFAGFDKVIWDSSWVSGEACWMDYEFNGDLTNVGTDTGSLSRDQDGGKYIYGEDATSDFRPVPETEPQEYDALYAGSHPYRVANWKDTFSCAMFGTLPQCDYSALLVFGSTTSGTKGGIALMTGKVSENQVLLVRWTGGSGDDALAQKYVVMAEMSVPNAYDNSHLYVFSKNGREVKVYLDGTLWTTYTSETDFAMGNGFQICSVHGGSFSTGINRFFPGSVGGLEDPRSYKCVIEALRLYDGELGENAIAALVDEFSYECPNGNYSRTFAGEENWVKNAAWINDDGEGVNEPADGSKVTINAEEAATILVNLDAAKSYESITFNGEVTVKQGGEIPAVNAGLTTVNAPITIEAGAMTIAGGPTKLGEEGAIAFDYSKADLAAFAGGFVQLTGSIEPSEKVTCDLVEDATYYTASFGYDEASSTYRITVVAKERTEGTEIYLADATETMNLIDETRFVDANGASIPRIAADTIILDDETLATLNVNAALTVPLSEIKTKRDLTINFGNVNGVTNIEVVAGTLKTSSAYTGKIVIDEGATYDVDSKDNWTAEFVMNGGTLANTGNPTIYDHVQVYKIDFKDDSIINAASAIMSVASGWNQFDYKLNGHQLTKNGAGEYLISKGNFVGGGAVIVNEGIFTLDAFTIPEETTLIVSVPNGATFTVMDGKNHGFAKNGTLQFYGNNAIIDIKKSVTFDIFSTQGEPTIKLADGAVLTATTFAYNNESFTLDLSAMTLGEEPITLINAAGIDTGDITLVLPEGVTGYELAYEDNVLKLIKSAPQINGTMIFLR